MSVTQVPLRPVAKGTLIKLWLAIAALVALAYGIAYFGAGQFKTVTFDTTEGRGATPFLVMQLFPGFKQALAQMQQGGRYKIVVPGRLAYGKNPPAGSPIGVNEDLSFDVYVQQVVPNAALSAGAAQPPQ